MTADRTTKARVPPGGGKLYLCATPIGNLRDVTLRVLETLREVALIAAEDTRTTRKLLAHYDIHTPLVSYHRDNARIRQPRILEALRQGQKVALVTESGTPTISDPGYDLVRAAIAEGFPVVPVPGPSALLAALVVSGLPSDRFVFEGFLPRKGQKRHARLTALRTEPRTIVLFEAPHRLLATLRDLADTLGPDRPVAVARELTKVHEEILRTTLGEAQTYFEHHPPRGEFTLIVAGTEEEPSEESKSDLTVEEEVAQLMAAGWSRKEAIKRVAARRGLPKREVYAAVHREGQKDWRK